MTFVERGLQALPGVDIFLARLRAASVPSCVGSSTHRENITTILDVLGFAEVFDKFVTAEDVTLGKPHPDVFLEAAAKISRAPAHWVVFEDALAGIEAAHAGGMKVIGGATTHDAKFIEGKVHRVVHRLDELEIEDLLALF